MSDDTKKLHIKNLIIGMYKELIDFEQRIISLGESYAESNDVEEVIAHKYFVKEIIESIIRQNISAPSDFVYDPLKHNKRLAYYIDNEELIFSNATINKTLKDSENNNLSGEQFNKVVSIIKRLKHSFDLVIYEFRKQYDLSMTSVDLPSVIDIYNEDGGTELFRSMSVRYAKGYPKKSNIDLFNIGSDYCDICKRNGKKVKYEQMKQPFYLYYEENNKEILEIHNTNSYLLFNGEEYFGIKEEEINAVLAKVGT